MSPKLVLNMTINNESVTGPDSKETKIRFVKKAAIVAILVNGFLGLIKTAGGVLFHSHGLIADGLHSLSDLLIDFMVVIGGHWSHQEADAEHPYGHQRIETAMTLLISLFLIFTGAIIAYDAFRGIIHPTLGKTSFMALILAGVSAIANEGLYRYTQHLNQGIKTDLLDACAWHHRSDALSALIVLLGIIGSLLGIHTLDHLAAIVVGAIIIKMGWDYTWDSIQQLIDRGVDSDTNSGIVQSIYNTPGVEKIHQLRTRVLGQDIFVDVHVLVDPFISVSAGHYIAQQVHHQLMKDNPRIKDVTVHIDSEDDETQLPDLTLPNSEQIAEQLIKQWRKKYPYLVDWSTHYIKGEIQLDLIINQQIEVLTDFKQQIIDDVNAKKWPIKTLRILSENLSVGIIPNHQ
jgi:cation diffusion facilitator family transporter